MYDTVPEDPAYEVIKDRGSKPAGSKPPHGKVDAFILKECPAYVPTTVGLKRCVGGDTALYDMVS